jgi:Lysyl oxidase
LATIATVRDTLAGVRVRFLVSSAAVLAGLALSVTVAGAATVPDPCAGPEARHLLCPNLRIGPPSGIYVDTLGGVTRLHATSDVRSRGRGPIELRGRRNGWRTMRVNQRIYRAGGGHLDVPSEATLRFTDVGSYFGGAFWKVHQLARFELRRAHPGGADYGPVVRTSPKLNYCLRDLDRTRPGRRSPAHRHYPGCNQNPYRNRVTLGTSVGWSDIYPADYDKQWIDVGGLRGCFAFEMTVDPKHLLFESNENDNTSHRQVRLPFTGDVGC